MKPFLLLLLALPACAQNSDLGILLGISPSSVKDNVGSSGISSNISGNFQIDYAIQVASNKAGAFYVELPLAIVAHVETNVGRDISSNVGGILFFTPGVRWKMLVQSRVTFYASLGGGVASFGTTKSVVGKGISTNISSSAGPALDVAGGIDFRLTRLLSLRGEVRDYVTRANAGGFTGRNHAALDFGVGFHF